MKKKGGDPKRCPTLPRNSQADKLTKRTTTHMSLSSVVSYPPYLDRDRVIQDLSIEYLGLIMLLIHN